MRRSSGNPKLAEANKCIFVRYYERAEAIVEELAQSKAHGDDLLIHLRRIELASKVDKLDELVKSYRELSHEKPDRLAYRIAFLFAQQQTDAVSNRDALERYQELLGIFGPHPGIYYGLAFSHELDNALEAARKAYEQCLNLDDTWHPAHFGLSQIHYQLGDEKKGDMYFTRFEELAPYNVYGNFETHRDLALEFASREDFDAAEIAIKTLGEWWIESKGFAPMEIQLYEKFATAKLAEQDQDEHVAIQRRHQGRIIANKILEDEKSNESVFYFAAKVLEEFSEVTLALEMYRRILRAEVQNPEMVQKIGAQFVSQGEYHLAKDLFEEAYKIHPDQPEVRFCLLVTKLKLAKVNVEEYLMGRERLKTLIEEKGDRTELMTLLMALTAKYNQDPEVQGYMAELYLELEHKDKALRHFQKMHELDPFSRYSALKYASFLMQHGDAGLAKSLIDTIDQVHKLEADEQVELHWLNASYDFLNGNFEESSSRLRTLLESEPWGLTYLVLHARALGGIAKIKLGTETSDSVMEELGEGKEDNLEWGDFDRRTEALRKAHCIELVYVRAKIRYLYAEGSESSVGALVKAAIAYDAQKASFELLRLLNTNFDSPNIYWALGVLFRESWQLETASMWFDQMLRLTKISRQQRAKAYLEQADCYIWRNHALEKAVEFVKIAQELGLKDDKRALLVLAHGCLKLGRIQQADAYLSDPAIGDDLEATYLKGLLKYRNGAAAEANLLWKPLLTYSVESLRLHHIKEEIMKYYYDQKPYRALN
jgi:tetratricopeptide (TPR) repeat protein